MTPTVIGSAFRVDSGWTTILTATVKENHREALIIGPTAPLFLMGARPDPRQNRTAGLRLADPRGTGSLLCGADPRCAGVLPVLMRRLLCFLVRKRRLSKARSRGHYPRNYLRNYLRNGYGYRRRELWADETDFIRGFGRNRRGSQSRTREVHPALQLPALGNTCQCGRICICRSS